MVRPLVATLVLPVLSGLDDRLELCNSCRRDGDLHFGSSRERVVNLQHVMRESWTLAGDGSNSSGCRARGRITKAMKRGRATRPPDWASANLREGAGVAQLAE